MDNKHNVDSTLRIKRSQLKSRLLFIFTSFSLSFRDSLLFHCPQFQRGNDDDKLRGGQDRNRFLPAAKKAICLPSTNLWDQHRTIFYCLEREEKDVKFPRVFG